MEKTKPETRDMDVIDNTASSRNVKIYKILKTGVYTMSMFCLGLFLSTIGPTLPELRYQLGVSTADISIGLSVEGAGVVLGSVILGAMGDLLPNFGDMWVAISLFVFGAFEILKPLSRSLGVYIFIMFIQGLAHGGVDASVNVQVLRLWGEVADSPLYIVHTGFNIGWVLAPFIVLPFLPTYEVNTTLTDNITIINETSCGSSGGNDGIRERQGDSRIQFAFLINGIIFCVVAVCLLVFQFTKPPTGVKLFVSEKRKNVRELCKPLNSAGGAGIFGVVMCLLFSLYFILTIASGSGFSYFLFSYALESDLCFTQEEAGLLDATNKLSGLLGRLTIIPLSAKILPIQPTLFISIFTSAVLYGLILFVGQYDKILLWVFACLNSFIGCPTFPGAFAWFDKYIVVSAIVVAFGTGGAGVGDIIFRFTNGYIFDTHGPDAILILSFSAGLCLCVLMTILQIMGSLHGQRYKDKEEEIETCIDDNIEKVVPITNDNSNTNNGYICDKNSVTYM